MNTAVGTFFLTWWAFNGASLCTGMTTNQYLRTFFIATENETKTVFLIQSQDFMTKCKVIPDVQSAELASTAGTFTQMTAF